MICFRISRSQAFVRFRPAFASLAPKADGTYQNVTKEWLDVVNVDMVQDLTPR
jgi:hypothetical protein